MSLPVVQTLFELRFKLNRRRRDERMCQKLLEEFPAPDQENCAAHVVQASPISCYKNRRSINLPIQPMRGGERPVLENVSLTL